MQRHGSVWHLAAWRLARSGAGRRTGEGGDVAGVYFYRLEGVEFRETKRMVLVR